MSPADSLYRVLRFSEQDGTHAVTLLGPNGVVEPFERFVVLHSLSESKALNTMLGYAYDLKHWFTWLHLEHRVWNKVKWDVMADFVAWLRYGEQSSIRERVIPIELTKVRKERTINRILSSVYTFYGLHLETPMAVSLQKYQAHGHPRKKAKQSKYATVRPVKGKSEENPQPKSLTREELDRLIAACDTKRDRLLITLLGERGMRVGQALGLRHEDISSRLATYKIVPRTDNVNGAFAKTDRTWVLPLRADMVALHKDYMYEEYGDLDCDYLFVNMHGLNKGQPMSYNGADKLRKKLEEKTGIKFTLHVLRHTFATLAISRGVSIAVVQTMMTHKDSSTTTSTYIHLKSETIRRHLDGAEIDESNLKPYVDNSLIQEVRQQIDGDVKRIR